MVCDTGPVVQCTTSTAYIMINANLTIAYKRAIVTPFETPHEIPVLTQVIDPGNKADQIGDYLLLTSLIITEKSIDISSLKILTPPIHGKIVIGGYIHSSHWLYLSTGS